jgi:hypothetical protein
MCPSHDRSGASTRPIAGARPATVCWRQPPSDDADQLVASRRTAADYHARAIKRATAAQRRLARQPQLAARRS